MALPALQQFEDCASWAKTVDPYIPQLFELPSRFADVLQGRESLVDLYTKTNPLISGLALSLVFAAVFFVVSEINRNYSQVDRCWSLLPTFYFAHFDLWARLTGIPSGRLDCMLAFSALWSTRLTYNYWRRGGYQVGSEDYRWEIVQGWMPRWAFTILNVTFISTMQSVILFLLAAPAYPILVSTQFRSEVDAVDLGFLSLELVLLTTEWFADQQQWDFQTAKYKYKDTGKVPSGFRAEDLDRGFNTSGLWAYSRHPNFAAEQTIWITMYAWSAVTTKTPLFWAAAGAMNLLSIFFGSTILTEDITGKKYPEYAHYQRQVNKFLPLSLAGYQKPAGSQNSTANGDKQKTKQQK